MSDRDLARFTAIGRIGIGTSFLLTPSLAMRPWLGEDAGRPGTRVLARALGARDLVLGVGVLAAMGGSGTPDRWLRASMTADAADLVATVAQRDGLPPVGRELVMAVAAGATAIGAKLVFFPSE